jgi:uncharacterized protein YecT (DUF1311 family)
MSTKLKYIFLAGFIFTSSPVFAVDAADVDKFLIGRWIVAEVRINGMEGRRRYYEYNDPSLRWRILNISSGSLEGNLPEIFSACEPLTVENVKMVADELLKDDMYASWGGAHFKQYDITINGDAEIEVSRFKCGSQYFDESVNSVAEFVGAWFIKLGDKLAMRWYDNTILILDKLPLQASVRPTFDCARKLNETEQAICGSDALSGYDKSVTTAYGEAIKMFKTEGDEQSLEELRSSQKLWLAERNKCRKNSKCMTSSMIERINGIKKFQQSPE